MPIMLQNYRTLMIKKYAYVYAYINRLNLQVKLRKKNKQLPSGQ